MEEDFVNGAEDAEVWIQDLLGGNKVGLYIFK